MKVSNPCGNGPLSSVQTSRFGANFVSPLQKAASREHAAQSHSWLEQCYEVVVSPANPDVSLSLPIDGGSDAGMFCVIGCQLDPARLVHHSGTAPAAASGGPRQLQPGDIILSLNEFEISGYTRRDAVELCDTLTRVSGDVGQNPSRIRIRLSPPQALATGSTMLSSFLAAAFPLNSPEYSLQEKIRENVYQRVVPCTTRLPRADEVDGVHYRFMSVPQFLTLERSGQLLESGMYKGNHYGTPRPDPNATALDTLIGNHRSISCSSSMTDDSCTIPPPLPPLASLSNVMGSLSTPSDSSSSSTGGSQHTLPPTTATPPPPPVRHSSITTQSTSARERVWCSSSGQQAKHTNGLRHDDVSTTAPITPMTYTNSTDYQHNRVGSIDLGPLSARNDRLLGQLSQNNYLIDCDLSGSQWKESGVSVVSCTTKTTATTATVSSTTTPSATLTNGTHQISSPETGYPDQDATAVSSDRELPYGWEVVQDPKYGTFYIDHINKRTQYEPPTEEDFALAVAVRSQLWSVGSVAPGLTAVNGAPSTLSPNGHIPVDVVARPSLGSSRVGRVTPTTFTNDPKQIKGPLITTTLVKSPRGFGFTVVGGADCNGLGYLQIKHLVPGGPASVNSCLDVGDVLVVVNGVNVLGYTHAEIVSLFQSIPVGTSITLTVSQAYRLRHEPDEPIVVGNTTPTPPLSTGRSLAAAPSADVNRSPVPGSSATSNSVPGRSESPAHSGSSHTASPHLSLSPPSSSSLVGARLNQLSTSSSDAVDNPSQPGVRPKPGQRPEFLKVSIFKQPNGFGFTLADHPQGQHVKAILDPARCGRLRVGDVVVEINAQRVKEIPHAEVVQILKQCPVGQEARLLIQRGGLYTSPLSLLAPDHHAAVKQPSANDDQLAPLAADLDSSNVCQTGDAIDPKTLYATPFTQVHNAIHLRTVSSTIPGLSIDYHPSMAADQQRVRARTPTAELDRRLSSSDLTYTELSEFGQTVSLTQHQQQHLTQDRRRRMQPSDDSALLDFVRPMGGGGGATTATGPSSPESSLQYGSLLRPGRMPPLLLTRSDTEPKRETDGTRAQSFLMLPGEFLVHLQRQSTGFGFTVVGGAEENSQITIGSLVPGGSAQMTGVVRTGDRLVSINGRRVIGCKHREVVQLLDQASHTVGQVTLGLQRPPPAEPVNGTTGEPMLRYPVEVVVPRSPKGDGGYGFFISNMHPRVARNGTTNEAVSQNCATEGEYIAQLVPGSKAERLGLLSVGDRILAVNKIPIAGMHHDQVVRLIRESGSHIVLTIIPSSASPWASRFNAMPDAGGTAVEFPVTLFRGSRGFGFSIRGGQEFNQMPLLVLRIADGGAAQMDGRLRVGDELIEINGYPTVGMSHGRAIEIIQAGGNTMQLIVRRRAPPPPQQQQSVRTGDLSDRRRDQHRTSLFRQFASTRLAPNASPAAATAKPQSPYLSRLNWLGLVKKNPGHVTEIGSTTSGGGGPTGVAYPMQLQYQQQQQTSQPERRGSVNFDRRVLTTATTTTTTTTTSSSTSRV